MLRIVIACIFCFGICICNAQDFYIRSPKQKKNTFAKSFVQLLNNAPTLFKNITEKPSTGKDSVFTDYTSYYNKIKLKGAVLGRIIIDSVPIAAYYYGSYTNMEIAEGVYVNLSNQIAESLGGNVLFKSVEGNDNTPWLRQTKIAFTQNSGFFLFNIFVELYKQKTDIDSTLTVILKVKGGKPPFYYKLAHNEPISSFMFASALKAQMRTFQRGKFTNECLGEIPPFICKGAYKTKDTSMILYTKEGCKDYPDAKKEFEVALTNIRVSLSDYYVYFLPQIKNNIREVVFLKFDDIEKPNPKTLNLVLKEKSKSNYILELQFVYK
ncbi:MAG: hypothetical protein KF781_05290 [Chitinophagaceae bacterium]|nr:hypothetical protein [Chitinophagaceae bacterium]MCW5905932.1 hypothetical protein [Chitinophagaceae bacterium]